MSARFMGIVAFVFSVLTGALALYYDLAGIETSNAIFAFTVTAAVCWSVAFLMYLEES